MFDVHVNGITQTTRVERKLDIGLFDAITSNMGYPLDVQRAKAMGMHPSSISKIRAGEVRPGRKFIEGVLALGIPYTAVFVAKEN